MAHDLPRRDGAFTPLVAGATRVVDPHGAPRVVRVSSEQLFADASEVQINHHGVLYRLKQTALGKLILTK